MSSDIAEALAAWNRSPASIAAAAIALVHAIASTAFAIAYLDASVDGPNGGSKLTMEYNFGVLSLALLVAGATAAAFAPRWKRKALLLFLNVVPMAWVAACIPRHDMSLHWETIQWLLGVPPY